MVYLAHHMNSSLFVLHSSLNCPTVLLWFAKLHSLLLHGEGVFGCWSTGHGDPVLLWFARLFTPLSNGEGEAAEWQRGGGAVDLGQ